jgi:hypothetical protein
MILFVNNYLNSVLQILKSKVTQVPETPADGAANPNPAPAEGAAEAAKVPPPAPVPAPVTAPATTGTPTTGTVTPAAPAATTGEPASDGKMKSNVVGKDRPGSHTEDLDISDCDQVVLMDAEKIKDHKDYMNRNSAFFTMNAYFVNMFEKKDAKTLIESININHIRSMPTVLFGTKTCLQFRDDDSFRNLTMCLKDEDRVKKVQDLFNKFLSCRTGVDLGSHTTFDVSSLLNACDEIKNSNGVVSMKRVQDIFTKSLEEKGVRYLFNFSLKSSKRKDNNQELPLAIALTLLSPHLQLARA